MNNESFFRPAHLPAAVANSLSVVAQHGADFSVEFPALDEDASALWRLNFQSLDQGDDAPLMETLLAPAELHWSGSRLRLAVGVSLLASWCASRYPALAFPQLRGALQAAALDTLLAELCAALAEGTPWLAPVVVPAQDLPACAHRWVVRATCVQTGETGLAVLEADDQGLRLLASVLRCLPIRQHGMFVPDSLPVALRAVLGHCSLSLAELQSLATGDVVLFDEYLVGGDGELWLTAGQGKGLRIRAAESGYLVTQGWTSLMHYEEIEADAVPPESMPQDVPSQLSALAQIPIRLSFDLGDRKITLTELRELRPGMVFDLHRPLEDGPVMIRANGVLIGTGALVEVDGRVGVRLNGPLQA